MKEQLSSRNQHASTLLHAPCGRTATSALLPPGTKALLVCLLALAALTAPSAPAEKAAVPRLPVKEVTVFKDGHAFVLHQGKVPIENGKVVMDYLPAPVIGTFWAYSADKAAKLTSVVAGQRRTVIERTALTLRELLEANVGAEALITETNRFVYSATIVGFPVRTPEELAATSPPNASEFLPEKSSLVLLRTAEGTKALPLDRIQDVTFTKALRPKVGQEEFRNFLTLNLDWNGRPAPKTAEVGLVYLQKGIRWIPSYKVDIDGQGKALVRLQATLLNELADLQDVTAQLVIGAPSFYFKDTIDPMALQQTAAELSQFFRTDAARGRNSALVANFSNTLMSQVARAGESRGGGDFGGSAPESGLPEGSKHEDLFIFTVRNVSLKKGERAILPLAEMSVSYTDVFALELPFTPPGEVRRSFNTQQQGELARLLNAPKVMHRIRLNNQSQYPFTTAPALLLRDGRILAQGMMTYAAVGASADVNLTAAVDIQVKKTDSEVKRVPNAFQHSGDNYMRVDLTGTIRLTNRRGKPVTVEVVRHVLGHTDTASQDGKMDMNNVWEDAEFLPVGDGGDAPAWWSWYGWPWWWRHVNSVGRINWKLDLPPGQPVEVAYTWHYYWR